MYFCITNFATHFGDHGPFDRLYQHDTFIKKNNQHKIIIIIIIIIIITSTMATQVFARFIKQLQNTPCNMPHTCETKSTTVLQ
jgi:flagellar basal body-associated protein FliL